MDGYEKQNIFSFFCGSSIVKRNIVNLNRNTVRDKFNGETALFQKGSLENPAIIRLLYLHSVNLNHQNNDGETALIKAIKYSRRDNAPSCASAKLLIRFGADLNKQDRFGFTALMWAIKNRLKEIILLLLSYGANITLKDHNGKTAEKLAEKLKRYDLFGDDPLNMSTSSGAGSELNEDPS